MKNKLVVFSALLSLTLSISGIAWVVISHQKQAKFGFINTQIMLDSYLESQKTMKEIAANEDKWLKNHQIIVDSLKAFEQRVSVGYDKLPFEKRKEIKDEQIRRIEELRRFENAKEQTLGNAQAQKMQALYSKINVAIAEFAALEGLDLVFATSNGNIVYGEGAALDLTNKFVVFLNKGLRASEAP